MLNYDYARVTRNLASTSVLEHEVLTMSRRQRRLTNVIQVTSNQIVTIINLGSRSVVLARNFPSLTSPLIHCTRAINVNHSVLAVTTGINLLCVNTSRNNLLLLRSLRDAFRRANNVRRQSTNSMIINGGVHRLSRRRRQRTTLTRGN